jgi:hypothetical protein
VLAPVVAWTGACTPYVPPPEPPKTIVSSVVVEEPFEEAWSAAIPALGQSFFVVNNLNKDSGFINISYAGDPTGKIDCRLAVPSCRPAGFLEAGISTSCLSGPPTMNVRMNLVFTKESDHTTRITANVRYSVAMPYVDEQAHPISAQTEFTTTQPGGFQVPSLAGATCSSTGSLEGQLTELLRSATPPPGSRVPPPPSTAASAPASPPPPSEEAGGIGVIAEVDAYARLFAKSIVSGGPADRAGVHASDNIIAIDGTPTAGMKLSDFAAKARGAPGTKVLLDVQRDGSTTPIKIEVVREKLSAGTHCEIVLGAEGCPLHPGPTGTFNDSFEGSERNEARCLDRAAEYRAYCGSTQSVRARFYVGNAMAQEKVSP